MKKENMTDETEGIGEDDHGQWCAQMLVNVLTRELDFVKECWVDAEFPTDVHLHTIGGKRLYIICEEEI